jgi:hypothetical protein
LPSVALGKGHTEERLSAKGTLPSAFRRALGKAFAERKVPRSANFKRRDGTGHVTDVLPSARIWHSAKTSSLPSVRLPALGKNFQFADFAECRAPGTWQSSRLCRVSGSRHSAKILWSLPSVYTRQRFFTLCRVFTLGKDSSDFPF